MLENARDHTELAQNFYRDAFEPTLKDLRDRIAFGQAQGYVMPEHDPEQIAEALIGAWEGLAFTRLSLHLTEVPFPEPKARIAQMLSLVRNGIQQKKPPA